MPTTVLHYNDIYTIVTKLKELAVAAFDKNPLYLTKDEYIEAFIRTDHIPILTQAADLTGESSTPIAKNINVIVDPDDAGHRVQARMAFFNSPGLMIPKYAETSFETNTPAGQKVLAWGSERRRLGLIVGDAIDAIHYFNEVCETQLMLALMLPAITVIMTKCGEDEDRLPKKGRKMLEGKKLGSIIEITNAQKERLEECNAVVQLLCMTSDAKTVRPKDACCVLVSQSDGGSNAYIRPHAFREGATSDSFV